MVKECGEITVTLGCYQRREFDLSNGSQPGCASPIGFGKKTQKDAGPSMQTYCINSSRGGAWTLVSLKDGMGFQFVNDGSILLCIP